jgi:type I restriction enzyme S subunit
MDGKQLKNCILQWAIQGKLVPQNPKDEPASKLLERIALARHSERSEESSKRSKKTSKGQSSRIYRENGSWYEQVGTATPKDISDEIPFEIPENWAWTNINSIARIVTDGEHLTPQRVDSFQGFYLLSARNILDGKISLDSVDYVDQSEYNRIANRCNPSRNDILISCSGSVGRVAVVNDDNCYVMVRSAAMIRVVELDSYYIMYALQSPCLQEQIQSKSKQTAQANLFQAAIRSLFIPIPPLAEQKRIVAKLEQVLPLAEEYGAAQEQLDKLNKELPEALKKSILQEAIQGKLVPQNPKDEPAQKLLERITVARSESSQPKGAKSKKSTPTSRIYCENGTWYEQIGNAEPKDITDEIPFDIPTSWVWCRFNSICDIARGGSPRPIQDYLTDSPEGYNWIKIGDTEKGGKYINSTKERIKPEGLTKTRLIHKGDFLLTNSMSFGRPYISNIDGCIHDGWLVISILGNAFVPDYLYYLLSSQYAYRQFCGRVAGAVVKNLNIDKVAESLIPLPPLAEQKRIVAKLEQLFKVL